MSALLRRRADSGGRGTLPPGGDDLPEEELRAPTEEEWARLTPEERLAVEAELLASDSLEQQRAREAMAEGEPHLDVKVEARDTLREFFRRQRPRLYVAAELAVYYPGQKSIQPDLIAVNDVETHPRSSWMVSREGKGPDLALEVHHQGSWRKDFVDNVERYAELGIREYFAFDLGKRELRGWRLPPRGRVYQPMRSLWGRIHSEVLDLDLMVDNGELRFFLDNAELLGGARLVQKLQSMVGDAIQRADVAAYQAEVEAERARAEAQRAETEAQRAETEAQRAETEAQRAGVALQALGEALLALLTQRGVALNDDQRNEILRCRDVERLSRWVARASQVSTAAELFKAAE